MSAIASDAFAAPPVAPREHREKDERDTDDTAEDGAVLPADHDKPHIGGENRQASGCEHASQGERFCALSHCSRIAGIVGS